MFAALAHAARRHVLLVVWFRGGTMTAGDIAGRFGHTWPTTSRHLRVLEDAGLLTHERQGRTRIYRVNQRKLDAVRAWLRWFAEPTPRTEDEETTMAKLSNIQRNGAALRDHAMTYPGAQEAFPWGETAIKVGGKAFLFMHMGDEALSLSCKLPASHEMALMLPFAKPTGYGLGKSGWVSASFGPHDDPPLDLLHAWIDESYRAIAPKKLAAGLGAGEGAKAGGAAKASASQSAKQTGAAKKTASEAAKKTGAAKKTAGGSAKKTGAAKKSASTAKASAGKSAKKTSAAKTGAGKPTKKTGAAKAGARR